MDDNKKTKVLALQQDIEKKDSLIQFLSAFSRGVSKKKQSKLKTKEDNYLVSLEEQLKDL